MSVHEKWRRIKISLDGDVYIALVIVLIGAASFGLGRLSSLEENVPIVEIYSPGKTAVEQTAAVISASESLTGNALNKGQYVVSKNGSKYHFPWCSGAQRIKEENKIWFDTKEEAERAGYTPAANCKGL